MLEPLNLGGFFTSRFYYLVKRRMPVIYQRMLLLKSPFNKKEFGFYFDSPDL